MCRTSVLQLRPTRFVIARFPAASFATSADSAGGDPACTLCGGTHSAIIHAEASHHYRRCTHCRLVWQSPSSSYLTPAEEVARYRTHENSPLDAGYRNFLAPLANAIATKVAPGARGLDFGCGPGPTLSTLLEERGLPRCVYYDPFFFPDGLNDDSKRGAPFDYVVTSEVVEHLYDPREVFERITTTLLAPGGWLGIMTSRVANDDATSEHRCPGDADFPAWWYHKDPTHVTFYAPESLKYAANMFGWDRLEFPSRSIALARRKR